ncbi:MAG: ion transporter [Solirubrobacterales bacterium]
METEPAKPHRFVVACARLAASQRFQLTIFGVIVLNAIVLGASTYDSIEDKHGDTLFLLNEIFLGIFIAEILIRLASYGNRPQDYFKDRWNVFDFIVVFAVFIPGVRENATILRLVRLLRVVRVISILPDLRVLISGMGRALKPIGAMAAMTILLLFVYGMVGVQLFGEEIPERWGNIGSAMLTLFTVLTLEGWNEILFTAQEVTQYAWIFLVSFVLMASFLVINILIAVIITSVEEAREEERLEEVRQRYAMAKLDDSLEDPMLGLLDRIGDMKRGLGDIEEELTALRMAERDRSE